MTVMSIYWDFLVSNPKSKIDTAVTDKSYTIQKMTKLLTKNDKFSEIRANFGWILKKENRRIHKAYITYPPLLKFVTA